MLGRSASARTEAPNPRPPAPPSPPRPALPSAPLPTQPSKASASASASALPLRNRRPRDQAGCLQGVEAAGGPGAVGDHGVVVVVDLDLQAIRRDEHRPADL